MSVDEGRVRREAEFHDRWARSIDLDALPVLESFEAATAVENRRAFEHLSPVRGLRLLDLGCGAGESSVYFALQGAEVVASDVSPEMLRVAERLAERRGVRLSTALAPAEKLPFPDGHFDLVFGNGVLHHVQLEPALREVRRVLKPGGKAAFVEPLSHNPLIGVYRLLADATRTADERPLRMSDMETVRAVFPGAEHREFWLTSLYLFLHFFLFERLSPSKVRYWKRVIEEAPRYERIFLPLKRLDDRILSACPWLGRFCWNTVLMAVK